VERDLFQVGEHLTTPFILSITVFKNRINGFLLSGIYTTCSHRTSSISAARLWFPAQVSRAAPGACGK
jgi:hypothetical protein